MTTDTLQQLDAFHQEDLNNPIHPSIYSEHANYTLLIVRLPTGMQKGALVLETRGFVLDDEGIYAYDKSLGRLVRLPYGWESLYTVLDEAIDQTLNIVNRYREAIMDMEETLYSAKLEASFLDHWFTIKKNLLLLNRILVRGLSVFEELYRHNAQKIEPLTHNFHDLLEHLTRSQRYIEHDIEKLNAVYSFYSAQSNDTMNRSIYLLTILSAIFLPLNLIVGFFGMNTGGLPFTQEGGTLSVVVILGGIMGISVLLFAASRLVKRGRKSLK